MSLSEKLNLKEIRKQYPADRFSVAQALVSYLEDTDRLVGAVGNIDAVALLAFFRTLDVLGEDGAASVEWDYTKYIEPIRNILIYELAGRADLAWETVEAVLSSEEEEENERISGTLGL